MKRSGHDGSPYTKQLFFVLFRYTHEQKTEPFERMRAGAKAREKAVANPLNAIQYSTYTTAYGRNNTPPRLSQEKRNKERDAIMLLTIASLSFLHGADHLCLFALKPSFSTSPAALAPRPSSAITAAASTAFYMRRGPIKKWTWEATWVRRSSRRRSAREGGFSRRWGEGGGRRRKL